MNQVKGYTCAQAIEHLDNFTLNKNIKSVFRSHLSFFLSFVLIQSVIGRFSPETRCEIERITNKKLDKKTKFLFYLWIDFDA